MTAASATDILIAASEIDDRLRASLASHRALFVRTFEEAQQALRQHLFRLIVIDLNFDDVRMFDLLHHVRRMPGLSGVFVDLRGPREAAGAFQRLSDMLQLGLAPCVPHPALCVLIIDHDVGAAHRLGEIVEQAGHDVDLAYDARSGLDAARRLRPDAVFVELALPLLSGYQLAQRLRSEPGTRDALIIALAAQAANLEGIREAGFDHRLVMPAEALAVRSLLAHAPYMFG